MSIIKNPIVIALIVSAITFVIATYFFKENTSKLKEKKSKNVKKKKNYIFNETVIISTAIAGMVSWFIASYYLTNGSTKSEVKNNQESKSETMAGVLNAKGGNEKPQISKLSTEDSTRSYNLIGSGLNIPDPNMIPKVLIDIKQ